MSKSNQCLATLFLSIAVCAAPNGFALSEVTSSTATLTAKKPDPAPLFQMHFENRVRSFREQNLVYQNVVLLGDSITEGFDVTKFLPGLRVLNRGIGADVIGNDLSEKDKRGVLKRLDESVFRCSPTDIFILIGINDLGQGHTPEIIEAGYREMLTRIRERLPKVKLHVQSLLPTRDNFAKHKDNIKDVNARIEKLASEFQANYVNLHTPFSDEHGELKKELTNDGLHILPAGYDIWAKIIREQVGWM